MPANPISIHATVWRSLLGAAVSIALIGLYVQLFTGAGKTVDLDSLWRILRDVGLELLLIYLLFQLLQAYFRARRYALLLAAAGDPARPPFFGMYLITVVRNMAADLLPARLGELAYVVMLNRGYRVGVDAGLSSLSISMVFDVAILVPIILALTLAPLAAATPQLNMLIAAAVLIVLVVLAFLIMFAGMRHLGALTYKAAARIDSRLLTRLAKLFTGLARAYERTRDAGVFVQTLAYTVAVRVVKYVGLYVLFLAVTQPNFPELATLAPWKVLGTLLASEAAASLPIPAFMSFGVYEGGGILALAMFGIDAAQATLAVLALHICSQAVDYLLGGVCLLVFLFIVPQRARNPRRGGA